MLKVTCGIGILWILFGCGNPSIQDIDIYEQNLQKVTEARIDSAYSAIHHQCDSLLMYEVPLKADSIFQSSEHE